MSLSADGLSLRLGGRAILDRVSLAIRPGTLTGLVGPNGAGKTTLLRILAGVSLPDVGTVSLDGTALAGMPRDARARRVAVLFQGAGVGWPMRVREVVELGRAPHRRAFAPLDARDHAAVDRALMRADAAHLAGRSADTLSTGEGMRVLLARALAVEAAWLLADEPITALDPGHQLDAMALLHTVSREGVGVVAVLHDLTLAARFCDGVIVLDDGRIAADGPPAAILSDALLERVFGLVVERGTRAGGTTYILPWSRPGSTNEA